MSNANKLSDIRAAAKKLGMTFKAYENTTFNGKPIYYLIDRKSKNMVRENMTLDATYNLLENGGLNDISEKNKCIA